MAADVHPCTGLVQHFEKDWRSPALVMVNCIRTSLSIVHKEVSLPGCSGMWANLLVISRHPLASSTLSSRDTIVEGAGAQVR